MAAALESSPDGILAPLNAAPQSERIKELIELVRTLQKIWRFEAASAEVDRLLAGEPGFEPVGHVAAPSELYRRANTVLSRYHWSPRVSGYPNADGFAWSARTAQSDWENMFVFWVVKKRASGEISLIRSCRNCGHWFYAITYHQTHCSDRCRQHFHSKDQHFKEKRRLYMSKYRAVQRARRLRAVERARLADKRPQVAVNVQGRRR